MLSFLRGSNSRDTSPKPHRKAEYVDTVKYTPKIDLDSVEIGKQVHQNHKQHLYIDNELSLPLAAPTPGQDSVKIGYPEPETVPVLIYRYRSTSTLTTPTPDQDSAERGK